MQSLFSNSMSIFGYISVNVYEWASRVLECVQKRENTVASNHT